MKRTAGVVLEMQGLYNVSKTSPFAKLTKTETAAWEDSRAA
jgi:hypothetical protein